MNLYVIEKYESGWDRYDKLLVAACDVEQAFVIAHQYGGSDWLDRTNLDIRHVGTTCDEIKNPGVEMDSFKAG